LSLLTLQLGAGFQGMIGPVVQEGDQGAQLAQDVEDIAAAGDVGRKASPNPFLFF